MNTTFTGHRTFQEGASAEASNRLFSYSGRIGRARFFWTCVTLASADSIVAWFVSHLDGGTNLNMWAWAIALVIGLNTYIGICAGIKRCHDLGRSGAFYFWVFIPVVGIFPFLLLLFTEGKQHANGYGLAVSGESKGLTAEPLRQVDARPTEVRSLGQMQSASPFDEDAAYLLIANELETKTMDKALWLKAMVHSNASDERQQTIFYTQLRLQKMREAVNRSLPEDATSDIQSELILPDALDSRTLPKLATPRQSPSYGVLPYIALIVIVAFFIVPVAIVVSAKSAMPDVSVNSVQVEPPKQISTPGYKFNPDKVFEEVGIPVAPKR